jgi:hypothetical protein
MDREGQRNKPTNDPLIRAGEISARPLESKEAKDKIRQVLMTLVNERCALREIEIGQDGAEVDSWVNNLLVTSNLDDACNQLGIRKYSFAEKLVNKLTGGGFFGFKTGKEPSEDRLCIFINPIAGLDIEYVFLHELSHAADWIIKRLIDQKKKRADENRESTKSFILLNKLIDIRSDSTSDESGEIRRVEVLLLLILVITGGSVMSYDVVTRSPDYGLHALAFAAFNLLLANIARNQTDYYKSKNEQRARQTSERIQRGRLSKVYITIVKALLGI